MKLKELKRTVNVCWSPAEHYPVTLAAGSAAQQVDASFSSSSYLELYSLNLEDPGSDLELKSTFTTQQKFHKIVWSGSEVIVGGCDGGLLQFYSSEMLLNNNTSGCLLGNVTKHNGNVSSLDINPYQKNLLASGASDSEIFIWDLNNVNQPMAPGNRSQPYDQVQGLAWNQQVQHILGSTFTTRCVVWDLRKNEPIMKLSDGQSRTRWRSLAWHPSVATQLCIASEDDQAPVIQLWDLRLAASPLVTLEGHHKGVMSVSWCKQEPDLLLSAGKDGRVLAWNPNNTQPGGELLAEVCQQQEWVFEVSWCPRDPSLLVATSFDQQVNLYSLLGGSKPETSTQSQSNIMESFGGMAGLSGLPAVHRAPPASAHTAPHLPHAPTWLKRPHAARFGFGGKLVTFDKCPQEAGSQKQVYISQVVSEPELMQAAAELDEVLSIATSLEPDATTRLVEYIGTQVSAAERPAERQMWAALQATFLPTFKTDVLNLLGFKQDEIPSKFKSPATGDALSQPDPFGLSRGESTETEAEISTDTSTDLSDAQTLIERKLSNLDLSSQAKDIVIPNGEDTTSLICRALVCGNLEEAVELCLEAKRIADALIIASLGSPELLLKVQQYHLSVTSRDPVSVVAGALVHSQWDSLVERTASASWAHTLAALLTHTQGDVLAHAAKLLGDKLFSEKDPTLSDGAPICYLVASAADAIVSGYDINDVATNVPTLQRATTLALLARRAAQHRGRQTEAGGRVDSILTVCAARLAAQGLLHSALNIVAGVSDVGFRDRLEKALGLKQHQTQQAPQQQYGRARTVSAHSHKGGYNNAVNYNSTANYNTVNYNTVNYNQAASAGWPQQNVQPASLPPIQPLQPLPPIQPLQPLPPIQPLQPPPAHTPQPPRPASVGPQGGISSRSKYKVDPSVAAPAQYNNYSFNNPVTSQPSYGYNSPLPDQYNSSVPNTFTPINPINPVNPSLNPLNPGLNPLNPASNPVNPGVVPSNPAVNGGYYSPAVVEPALQAVPHSKPMQAGWNDPPMLSASKPKPKQEVQSQAPITHPLYGVEPPQHVPLNPTQQYPGQQQFPGQQQYPGQQQQYPGQQQQYPGQQYGGQYDQQYQQGYQQQGYQQQAEPPAPAPEPVPVQKGPVPEQHTALQSVFDRMRAECSEKAQNPQMKRKLEDVQRRLETLYDMLREYKLSESALQTLHACVAHASNRDYSSAAAAATSLASGADFAAAAAFLPGLKVLLQIAEQLQVYVS